MANEQQLAILRQGVEVWNKWRKENSSIKVDLQGADLSRAKLSQANLDGAHLTKAQLNQADFSKANLAAADLSEANLIGACLNFAFLGNVDLQGANLSGSQLIGSTIIGANLSRANFNGARLNLANLSGSNLTEADLRRADLTGANLLNVRVDKAKLTGSSIYGINVWELKGAFEEQKDLVITLGGQPRITVDDIKIAQFIYLILNNESIRDAIDTLTSKTVLILGRFTPERKALLDALRIRLREYNLIPMLFDFERPTDKDFTETIKTLAGLCYFVIADVTNPKSSPLELQATVPDYQIPFVPIIQEGESPFAMMVDLQKKYNWVLNTVSYDSEQTLMRVLKPLIIDPAMNKRNELRRIKAQIPEVISGKDFLGNTKE